MGLLSSSFTETLRSLTLAHEVGMLLVAEAVSDLDDFTVGWSLTAFNLDSDSDFGSTERSLTLCQGADDSDFGDSIRTGLLFGI